MDQLQVRILIEIYTREIEKILESFDSEIDKRIYLYTFLQEHNKSLIRLAINCGLRIEKINSFVDKGFEGLYGLDRENLKKHKGLPLDTDIYEYMGVKELFINLIHVLLTEEKLGANLNYPRFNL